MGDILDTVDQEVTAITANPMAAPSDHQGLTDSIAMLKKAVRWGVTEDMRQRMPGILWGMVNDDKLPTKPRREAMKILALLESMNQKDQHAIIAAQKGAPVNNHLTINAAVAKVELSSPERARQAAGLVDGQVNVPEPPRLDQPPETVRPGQVVDEPEKKPEVIDIPSVKDPA